MKRRAGSPKGKTKKQVQQLDNSAENGPNGSTTGNTAQTNMQITPHENGSQPGTSQQPGPSSSSSTQRKRPEVITIWEPLANSKDKSVIHVPWLTVVKPSRRPYLPQIGDNLIYFRQGHANYVEAVLEGQLFSIPEDDQPYVADPDLPTELPCRLISLSYELAPPFQKVSVAVLTLRKTHWETGNFIQHEDPFKVQFHHLEGIADFLILREYYDAADKSFKKGDKFRTLHEESWWMKGKIVEDTQRIHKSNWERYTVSMETEEIRTLSPWDIERIPSDQEDLVLPTKQQIEDSLLYPEQWKNQELPRLECLFTLISTHGMFQDFRDFPTGMNLNIILSRMRNKYYRRTNSIAFDVDLMQNFVERDPILMQRIRNLRKVAERTCSGPEMSEDQLSYSIEHILQNGTNAVDWKTLCFHLVEHLFEAKDSMEFRNPVNIDVYPSYYQQVEEPIFLSGIMEKFLNDEYLTMAQFEKDMELLFSNARTYYKKPSPTLAMADSLERIFRKKFFNIF